MAGDIFHNYTNWWVESLRQILPDTKYKTPGWIAKLLGWPNSATTEGKDLAYIVGHIVIYLHVLVAVGAVIWWLGPILF